MFQSAGHTLHCRAVTQTGMEAPEPCHTSVGHCTFSFLPGGLNEEQIQFQACCRKGKGEQQLGKEGGIEREKERDFKHS